MEHLTNISTENQGFDHKLVCYQAHCGQTFLISYPLGTLTAINILLSSKSDHVTELTNLREKGFMQPDRLFNMLHVSVHMAG